MPNPYVLPFTWGQSYYNVGFTTLGTIVVGPLAFGVSMLSLSPDGTQLYYSKLSDPMLYSVCTNALLNNLPSSGVAKTVRNHGAKGQSFSILCDQRGRVWSGCVENDGITVFNPSCPFGKNFMYIRDPRLNWPFSFVEPGDGDESLVPNPYVLPFTWGQSYYNVGFSTPGTIVVGPLAFGVSMLSISPDGTQLYYSKLSDPMLYSVCTNALLNNLPSSEVAKTVRNHGAKGQSFSILCDQRGRVWSGCVENDGITVFNPSCPLGKNFMYIRDPRLNWPFSFVEPGDGYIYFIINSLSGLPLAYPGTGLPFVDRRKKPYVVLRFKSPCESLCPSFCDPATLGLQICSCG
nr:PREDICTED: uncharacterized protein LOC109032228 [Bemisia tabaci]